MLLVVGKVNGRGRGRRATLAKSTHEKPLLWAAALYLVLFLAVLFAGTLACQRLFDALLLARFQVIGVTLHFLNYVFRLNLALETAKGIL
jgi:hypothetical protein